MMKEEQMMEGRRWKMFTGSCPSIKQKNVLDPSQLYHRHFFVDFLVLLNRYCGGGGGGDGGVGGGVIF